MPRISRRLPHCVVHLLICVVTACGDSGGTPDVPAGGDGQEAPDNYLELQLERIVASTDSVILFRIGDVVVRQDGGLVVANAGAHSLVVVDGSGAPTGSFGRKGSGPGEFEGLTSLRAADGDLAVWDLTHRRLTTYTGDVQLRRAVRLELPGAWRLIAATRGSAVLVKPPHEDVRVRRYVLIDSTGSVLHSWERSGHPRGVVSYPSHHALTGQPGRMVMSLEDCMPETLEAGVNSSVYSVDTAEGTVELLLDDGSARVIYRSPHRTRFGQAARQKIEASIHNAPPDTLASALRRAGAPDRFVPMWRRVVAGDSLMFLERAVCAPGTHPRIWDVVAPDGIAMGSFVLRADESLAGASRELLAVVAWDSLEVEHLRLYRVEYLQR